VPPPPPSLARRLFWRTRPSGRLLVDRTEQPFLDAHRALPADSDPRAAEVLTAYSASPWREYALELDREHVFEPACGWAVQGLRTRIELSLVEGERCHPSPGRYLARRLVSAPRRAEECLISLRTAYEGNYWHLFDDVFPRLALLDDLGVPEETPILVGAQLWERPYFQHFVDRGPLRHRTWIVQGRGRFVRAQRSYIAKTLPPDRARFDKVMRMLAVEPSASSRERRLFVTRGARFGRVLRNAAELERIAAGAGFETVEPAELDAEEQIRLFSEARTVVGVHGAGLANLLFRAGRPLDLLELFSPARIGPQYFWLAAEFGYRYRGLVGKAAGTDQDFAIPPAEFERELALICDG